MRLGWRREGGDGPRHEEQVVSGREGKREEGREGRTEVGVHQLHNGSVAIHGLSEGLANKVSFVNDLICGTKFPECLLGQLWDVVGGAGLNEGGEGGRGEDCS